MKNELYAWLKKHQANKRMKSLKMSDTAIHGVAKSQTQLSDWTELTDTAIIDWENK